MDIKNAQLTGGSDVIKTRRDEKSEGESKSEEQPKAQESSKRAETAIATASQLNRSDTDQTKGNSSSLSASILIAFLFPVLLL